MCYYVGTMTRRSTFVAHLALAVVLTGALALSVLATLGLPLPRSGAEALVYLLALGSVAPAAGWRHFQPAEAKQVQALATAGLAAVFVASLAAGMPMAAGLALLCGGVNLLMPLAEEALLES